MFADTIVLMFPIAADARVFADTIMVMFPIGADARVFADTIVLMFPIGADARMFADTEECWQRATRDQRRTGEVWGQGSASSDGSRWKRCLPGEILGSINYECLPKHIIDPQFKL